MAAGGQKRRGALGFSSLFSCYVTCVTQTCDPGAGKGNFRALKMLCVGEKQMKTGSGQPNFNSCFPSLPETPRASELQSGGASLRLKLKSIGKKMLICDLTR